MTTPQKHRRAKRNLDDAATLIRAAIAAEDGLEWTGRLQELYDEALEISSRLAFYASEAEAVGAAHDV